MFIVDLKCENQHRFEGWYDSNTHYYHLLQNQGVKCPLCGSSEVSRRLAFNEAKNIHSRESLPPFSKMSNFSEEIFSSQAAELPMTPSEKKAIGRILEKIRSIQSETPRAIPLRRSIKLARHQAAKIAQPKHSTTKIAERDVDIEGQIYYINPPPDYSKN